jgi:hypothetical protein
VLRGSWRRTKVTMILTYLLPIEPSAGVRFTGAPAHNSTEGRSTRAQGHRAQE